MLFSSIPFLFYFLPPVLLLYFLTPDRWKNLTLLLSSLVFYGWGEDVYKRQVSYRMRRCRSTRSVPSPSRGCTSTGR